MSILKKNKTANHSATISEAEWIKKKNALLKKRSSKSGIPMDMETLQSKKMQLIEEIAQLEEKNHGLKKVIKDTQFILPEKKRQNIEVLKKINTQKSQLNKYLATERNVVNEISFYENEQNQLDNSLKDLTNRLNSTIGSVDDTLMNIDFVKGEIKAMLAKMNLLERNIPDEYAHMDHLDDLFQQTIQSLNDLYDRAHRAEKSVKKTYYKIKKQRRGSQ
ncbi:magnetosomen protein Mad24-1 [Candidatus Magnetomorum sp. HK-1]|nr:magnetosomen protein Mad24-1 [Candidatus Magnetomorum sp. HK-1]